MCPFCLLQNLLPSFAEYQTLVEGGRLIWKHPFRPPLAEARAPAGGGLSPPIPWAQDIAFLCLNAGEIAFYPFAPCWSARRARPLARGGIPLLAV